LEGVGARVDLAEVDLEVSWGSAGGTSPGKVGAQPERTQEAHDPRVAPDGGLENLADGLSAMLACALANRF